MIKGRLIYLLIAAGAAWLFGAVSTVTAAPGTIPAIFPTGTPLVAMVVAVFAFSFLFFGYSSPLVMFFAGMHTGLLAQSAPGFSNYVAVAVVSTFIAAYAAIRLGDALLEDMAGKGNFKGALRISAVVIAIAFVTPAIADYAMPAPQIVRNCLADEDCFRGALEACEPAKVRGSYNITVYKEIRGAESEGCRIYVSASSAKNTEMEIGMADKEMECFVPLGYGGLSGDPHGWTTGSYCTGGMAGPIKVITGGK